MNFQKILYWLTKLGIVRTTSYKVKGSADKLAEMHAKDGGMNQSQKESDEKFKGKI